MCIRGILSFKVHWGPQVGGAHKWVPIKICATRVGFSAVGPSGNFGQTCDQLSAAHRFLPGPQPVHVATPPSCRGADCCPLTGIGDQPSAPKVGPTIKLTRGALQAACYGNSLFGAPQLIRAFKISPPS